MKSRPAICLTLAAALALALTACVPTEGSRAVFAAGGPSEGLLSSEGLRVLVDTWGMDPPADGVSAERAAEVAAEAAKRYLGMTPAARATVRLFDTRDDYRPEQRETSGDFEWLVELEAEEGNVSVIVDALTGIDLEAETDRDFTDRYEGTWLEEFDEWERTGISPSAQYFGSDAEALDKAADELIPKPPTDEELSDEELAASIESELAQREIAARKMAEHRNDPRAEAALSIVNEMGIGGDARAVSAEWASTGNRLIGYSVSTSMIDVALDNGEHLFCHLRGFDPDYELMAYERHKDSFLDYQYGRRIAKLQALMDQSL